MKIEMGFVLGSRGRIFITVIIGGLIGSRWESKHEFDSCYNLYSSEFFNSDDSSSTFGIRIIGERGGEHY